MTKRRRRRQLGGADLCAGMCYMLCACTLLGVFLVWPAGLCWAAAGGALWGLREKEQMRVRVCLAAGCGEEALLDAGHLTPPRSDSMEGVLGGARAPFLCGLLSSDSSSHSTSVTVWLPWQESSA
jgi:hypothetical protein